MKRSVLIMFALLPSVFPTMVVAQDANPPMPDFDLAGSDARAMEIADEVMVALGGREAWDETRFITWRFFGKRLHVWDKWTGDIRIEVDEWVILMNINTGEGRAWVDGEETTDPEDLARTLQSGREYWINDSYWMFMPYKLKDSGVTLKYLGSGTTQEGHPAHVLQLTFKHVGVTPQNKYRVYVDPETHLVVQWDYFTNATDREPKFMSPWRDWKRCGNIMLSDDRGRSQHTDIAVFDELPQEILTSPAPVSFPPQAEH